MIVQKQILCYTSRMKIIFTDIDGTFLDFGGYIPPSAVEAVHRARAKGNRVFVNTGRPKAEITPNISCVGFDGYICSNGMYIEEAGEQLHYECMDAALVREVCGWMDRFAIGYFLEGQEAVYTNPFFLDETARGLGQAAADALERSFPGLFRVCPLVYDGIAKINLVNRDGKYEELKQRFGDRLQIAGWTRTGRPNEMAEITKLGASKAKGCRFMLERYGLTVADSYAFGDTGGDADMLRYCGTGVAMGNGTDEAKAAADYVTGTVREDGLIQAFEKFGLV